MLQILEQFVALHPMLLSSLRVRHPIRFRPPSDQIPSATQSDSVRCPIRFRPLPDQIPSAALIGGAAVSAAPTKQATNQASNQPINKPTNKPFNFTHQKQPYIQQKH